MDEVTDLVDEKKLQSEGAKPFAEVRRKRKRDKESEMEVSEASESSTPVKRPFFPPVDASSTLVNRIMCVCKVILLNEQPLFKDLKKKKKFVNLAMLYQLFRVN